MVSKTGVSAFCTVGGEGGLHFAFPVVEDRCLSVRITFVFREGVADSNTGSADEGVDAVLFNLNALVGLIVDRI